MAVYGEAMCGVRRSHEIRLSAGAPQVLPAFPSTKRVERPILISTFGCSERQAISSQFVCTLGDRGSLTHYLSCFVRQTRCFEEFDLHALQPCFAALQSIRFSSLFMVLRPAVAVCAVTPCSQRVYASGLAWLRPPCVRFVFRREL